ncbi:hypothetical protein JKP88DRAFT_288384 [Tribonema minus]|uniref:Ammonium transporter AmtB-like domain-containing protein n=1 Tax=Tribonema minus TaxID=303371 RepID=A0A835Z7E1_9STRA|nr:hypothetical protein JKP88DRAFT_288384 [Tribonema minus]
MALQTPVYALNQHLVIQTLGPLDMGGTIVVHAFGCYYGLAASVTLSRHQHEYGEGNPKLSLSHMSDVVSMAAAAQFLSITTTAAAQFLSIANTVLALLGSTLSAFAASSYLGGKLSAIAVQNATLAGDCYAAVSADVAIRGNDCVPVGDHDTCERTL